MLEGGKQKTESETGTISKVVGLPQLKESEACCLLQDCCVVRQVRVVELCHST